MMSFFHSHFLRSLYLCVFLSLPACTKQEQASEPDGFLVKVSLASNFNRNLVERMRIVIDKSRWGQSLELGAATSVTTTLTAGYTTETRVVSIDADSDTEYVIEVPGRPFANATSFQLYLASPGHTTRSFSLRVSLLHQTLGTIASIYKEQLPNGELLSFAPGRKRELSFDFACVANVSCAGDAGANQPPVLGNVAPQSINIKREATLRIAVGNAAYDREGDTLTFAAYGEPMDAGAAANVASIDSITGLFSWTPAISHVRDGGWGVTFAVADPMNVAVTRATTINVRADNSDPVWTPVGERFAVEGQTLSVPVSVYDPDNEAIAVLLDVSGLPAGANAAVAMDGGDGAFTWTPTSKDGRATPYTVTLTARDPADAAAVLQFDVRVGNVNDLPVVSAPDSLTLKVGSTSALTVTASDPDGELVTLTADFSALPTGYVWDGTTDPEVAKTGTLRWNPSAGDVRAAPYVATLTAVDVNGGGTVKSVSLYVLGAESGNAAPTLSGPAGPQAEEGRALSFAVSASDPESAAVTLAMDAGGLPAGQNAAFVVDGGAGIFSWTPAAGTARGDPYRVTFTATDVADASTSLDVFISVFVPPGDTTPPETYIDGGPANGSLVAVADASFDLSCSEPGCSVNCQIDDAGIACAVGTLSLPSLAEGQHTLVVAARDDAGNADPSPATRTWFVDTTPPETYIDGGPANGSLVAVADASFDLSCSEPGCTVACKLDDAGIACDAGALAFPSLAEGQHTLVVTSRDDAGNADQTPAARTWFVDTTPPVCAMSVPALIQHDAGTVSGTASDVDAGVASVSLRFDDAGGWVVASGTTSWSAPWTPNLLRHTVEGTVVDAVGNYGTCGDAGFYTSGIPAVAVIGQSNFTDECPGGPGTMVRAYPQPYGLALDVARARLFIVDNDLDRIAVHQLNSTTFDFIDDTIDYVIGMPNVAACRYDAGLDRRLDSPGALAFDDARSLLFISELSAHRVVVFDVSNLSSGQPAVTVLGQSTLQGYNGGLSDSKFNEPTGLAYDSPGKRLFVSDSMNNRVLVFDVAQIDAGEAAITVLGQPALNQNSPDAGPAGMRAPLGLSYSAPLKQLFVADNGNRRVLVFDVADASTGQSAVAVLGQPDFQSTTAGLSAHGLSAPWHVEVESDGGTRLFVADNASLYNRIVVYNIGGGITNGMDAGAVLGQPSLSSSAWPRGPVTAHSFHTSGGLLHMAQGNRLFFSDYETERILRFDTAAIVNGADAGFVLGQTYDGGQRFNTSCHYGGSPTTRWGGYNAPIAVDAVSRRLYVGNHLDSVVLVYSLDATLNPTNTSGTADYALGMPNPTTCTFGPGAFANTGGGRGGLSTDETGDRLFCSDENWHRLLIFQFDGGITNNMSATYVLGQADFSNTGCSTSASRLCAPWYSTYDGEGQRLFVADKWNNRVLIYNFDGGIANGMDASVVLGQIDFDSATAGSGATGMSAPTSVAYDRVTKNLFVADSSNHRVLVFSAASPNSGADAGYVLGQPDFATVTAGNTFNKMNQPLTVAVDATRRRLFVSEATNRRVLVFDLSSLSSGMSAVSVIGKGNFSDVSAETSAANLVGSPEFALAETLGRLFIVDRGAARILVFDVRP